MNLASMFNLVEMITSLYKRDDHNNKGVIEDFCFCDDGKSIWVQLSNGEEYKFSVR